MLGRREYSGMSPSRTGENLWGTYDDTCSPQINVSKMKGSTEKQAQQ